MDWITGVKIAGMIATLIFIGFLIRELISSIKKDKEGNSHRECDLD